MSQIYYTESELNQLTKNYSLVASWAIWNYGKSRISEKSAACIKAQATILNANYVIIGLNISSQIIEEWGNFRGGKHDRKLKYAFNDSPLKGCYMTDLFKNVNQKLSAELYNKLSTGEISIEKHSSLFSREMTDIKSTSNTTFIILGKENSPIAKIFKSHFQDKIVSNKIIYHKHYSSRGTDKAWVESIWKQLGIEAHFDTIKSNYKDL